MKKILLFLLLPVMLKAQYIHPFEYFSFDYTTNRVEYFPIGNIGFDTKLNPYNPDIINDSASFFINVSAYTNLSQTIYENDDKRFIEDRKLYPNFIAQYQNDWYAFQLSYVNSMLSSLEGINRNWEFNFYPTVNTDVLFIPAVNTTLQLSSIFKLSDQFNASIGVITNNFETQFVMPDQGYVKYKRSFFDNIQVNAALNFNYDDFIKCYLLVRSESPDKELEIEHSLVSNSNPFLDHPDVFFNGLVSAGIKINVLDNLGLSLETKNDFVNYEADSPYFGPYYTPEGSGQFNARIMSGINYKPFDFAQIGILYSTYFNYKNPFHFGDLYDVVNPPYAVILGASVSYSMLDFNFQYQYSGYEIKSQRIEYSEKYQNHYIGFGVGVKM